MKTILLFDVDGTLTEPRKRITHDMIDVLSDLKQKYSNLEIGYVGGSNLCKQKEQLGEENFDLFDWRFSENGLEGYYCDKLIHTESFVRVMGETHYSKFINICLYVLSSLECPVKRGTFIEYRNGMLNISPIGRACSQQERDNFDYNFKTKELVIFDYKYYKFLYVFSFLKGVNNNLLWGKVRNI